MDHLPLVPRCGACADTIFRHERVVALSNSGVSTAHISCTRPFPFPENGTAPAKVDGLKLCRRNLCLECARAPEFVPVHYDCYEIFTSVSKPHADEALVRLWTVALWRNIWQGAPLVHLDREDFIDQSVLGRMAGVCRIPQLANIPRELVDSIRQFSQHSLFWRSILVIRLASESSSSLKQPYCKIPLDNIQSWERGGELIRASHPLPPAIRLTIDQDGISKIERLHAEPPYCDVAAKRQAFIVQNMPGIDAELKDGLLRLCRPLAEQLIQIWNTPAPPGPDDCLFLATGEVAWYRLHVVNLDRVRGLTFFFVSGQLFGIHVHDSKDSSAMETCARFPEHHQRKVTWVYLPIAPKDRVVLFGRRMTDYGLSILVRMQLAGDVILGRLGQRVEPDRLLIRETPPTLIYQEPEELQPVFMLGGYDPRPPFERKHPPLFWPQDYHTKPSGSCFSWAPLSGVAFVQTFFDDDNGMCRGILIRYENGGSRALGQCRLHVDSSVTVVKPTRLCFQPTTYLTSPQKLERSGVRAEFGQAGPHEHTDGEGWECLPLCGTLKFSFTQDSSCISVGDPPS